ncbi:molecular chaperone DnaJ [Prochlorococcus marinus]|uniref:Molecular chaperone DnaJ n=1 Tax=Prochlorococcus marinus XMU1408 TaxID=2213228 RepID=A0A318R6A4_PROMR|nr:molecular chaperone DnaJ [Prochlorococcus marinus]MBW3041966.1 molecular chaperone DnaJ [Prochlorococcus marinus str. XMU1408]PYE03092.1 molecular chaperone DnaJ [Prochlorococcus marinus XMU1408]
MSIVTEGEDKEVKRISIDLPIELIDGVDRLRKEWGLRRRGLVFERLLQVILSNDIDEEVAENEQFDFKQSSKLDNLTDKNGKANNNNEEKALVIFGNKNVEIKNVVVNQVKTNEMRPDQKELSSTGIELPGFIRKQTTNLKRSLSKDKTIKNMEDTSITTIDINDLVKAKDAAEKHWIYLYGQKPTESVIEASMIWFARDIWPNVDGTENIPFTWNAACKMLNSYCNDWKIDSLTFDHVIILAGALEDPFSTKNLRNRIPTIIRRFVNKFKRSQNVTSFQTLESTMTVHGALKLLGLPTKAGSSLTLSFIRDAYKEKALSNHPDAGGSNETMRKLNEAYQLLKDLYKN